MALRTRDQLQTAADTLIPDNDREQVSPADVRERIEDLADSALLREDRADDDLIDGESDDNTFVTVRGVFRAIARKVQEASAAVAGLVVLSNADPVGPGEARAGGDDEVSRADHRHPPPSGAQVKAALETLRGDDRLDASAIKDLPSGGGPTQTHSLRAGWSGDTSISDLELEASSDSDTVTLPTGAGSQYLALWRADEDGGDPSEVHISGGGNSRNLFGAAVDRTFGATDGKLIVSVNLFDVALTGGEEVRLV